MIRLSPISACILWSLALSACRPGDRAIPPEYASLVAPPGLDGDAQARSRGQKIFRHSCSPCHGERGDGRGKRRDIVQDKPADFTDPAWRAPAMKRRIFVAIREGVPNTSMASWKMFSEEQTWDLVAYVQSISSHGP